MNRFKEGKLVFTFNERCCVVKLDDWPYYRSHLTTLSGGCKAVDFVVYDQSNNDLWLIEVKDYRSRKRGKNQSLVDEFVEKFRDSLALLVIGKARADEMFKSLPLDNVERLRAVLHVELTTPPSRLFPEIVQIDNAQLRLNQILKKATVRPLITNVKLMQNKLLPWSVMM